MMEHPKSLGLTGIAIAKMQTLVSTFGSSETSYNPEIDNVARLKHVSNLLIIPLTVPGESNSQELVGVLHLLNYSGMNITHADTVTCIEK
jgi:hypothetical protein